MKLLINQDSFQTLREELRMAMRTKTPLTVELSPEAAAMLLDFFSLGEAARCRVTALEEAGLYEIAGCARHISIKHIP